MIIDQRTACLHTVRSKIAIPLTFLESVTNLPFQYFEKINVLVNTHQRLYHENLQLKTDQLVLKIENQRLHAVELENAQLKALVHAASTFAAKSLVAEVFSIDSDPFNNQVILNKGTHDGVFVGQPVMDANGVLGKIIETNSFSSRVLLINDSHSGIPVQDTRNGIRGIVMGDSYSDKLHLINVPQTVDIKVGDVLATSGLGDHYPAGYLVGKITNITKIAGMQFANIDVMPFSNSDRSRYVLLVWPNEVTNKEKS